MAPMRARLLLLLLLATAACHPPVAVDAGGPPVAPDYTGPVVGALEPSPETAPAPPPEPALPPEPPPTWEWALSVLPELAEHHQADPSEAALARFVGWFDEGGSPRVHVLLEEACHAIDGSMSGDGFHGSWRTEVTTEGDERRVSSMSFEITRSGITESGPGGLVYTRDAKGRWQESGGFGTGCFATLVDHSMSAADERSVTFASYRYRLEPQCASSETIDQRCKGGGERRCERCTSVWLQPKVDGGMGVGRGRIGVGQVDPAPVDCTQPCPVDEWTPRLPRLATALAGRTFHGVLAHEGPVVFRSAKGCARELRRRKIEAAAARRAEAAAVAE